MMVNDYRDQRKPSWRPLQETDRKQTEMPAQHTREEYLDAYIAGFNQKPVELPALTAVPGVFPT